jgi:hypothetical protein
MGETIAFGRSPAPTGETVKVSFRFLFFPIEKEEKERLE